MFDYQWNEMVRGYGLAQLTAPVYDKKLWLSDGMFEAPSLRSVTATICGLGAAGKTVMGVASAITNTALRITAQTESFFLSYKNKDFNNIQKKAKSEIEKQERKQKKLK